MDFALNPGQEALRASVVAFARASLNDRVVERDRDRVFSRELFRACGRQGLTGLPVEPDLGGRGLDPAACAVALEALGYGCTDNGLVFSVAAHLLSCVVPIWKAGSPEQRRRYLPGLCDGSRIGVLAVTEAEAGSDSFGMQTRADREDGGWRLTGSKTFIANAPHADLMIVLAVTDPAARFHGGITAFLVERAAPGVSVGPDVARMGLRTMAVGAIELAGVRVADAAVLGGVGGGPAVFAAAMDWERACLFAAHVGQMERLLEVAVAYARRRQVGGQAIGKHQAIAHTLADMKVRLDAARLLTYRAAAGLGRPRPLPVDAAVAKVFVSESLVEAAAGAVQILGANGYAAEHEVERALRDAFAARIYSGTSEVQRNIIAAWLGL
jgi:alkylation response protein AidB-like acyl-CoA dehydrogenase